MRFERMNLNSDAVTRSRVVTSAVWVVAPPRAVKCRSPSLRRKLPTRIPTEPYASNILLGKLPPAYLLIEDVDRAAPIAARYKSLRLRQHERVDRVVAQPKRIQVPPGRDTSLCAWPPATTDTYCLPPTV